MLDAKASLGVTLKWGYQIKKSVAAKRGICGIGLHFI